MHLLKFVLWDRLISLTLCILSFVFQYTWKLESNSSKIDVSAYSGPKLRLPGGTLKPDVKYTVFCQLESKDSNQYLLTVS